ncbi:hypothetical protein ACSYDW_14600 [Paeniglutamicibacter sp. R2-26]|uniref:hypothetical protein n=1 Tax=Paeniglutamicibacter sp. R2-26 TaxID=3144417 RepID=UPI003EE6547D
MTDFDTLPELTPRQFQLARLHKHTGLVQADDFDLEQAVKDLEAYQPLADRIHQAAMEAGLDVGKLMNSNSYEALHAVALLLPDGTPDSKRMRRFFHVRNVDQPTPTYLTEEEMEANAVAFAKMRT